jgi:hypothetical protein
MDFTAPAIQTQPAPANAGTKHLALLWQIFIAGCIFRIPERRFA